MEKKYQKLYIWSFIIISGIILAMLYTPLGGDLNKSVYGEYNNYPSSGVNFNGRIGNAPKNGRATLARNYNDAVPVNSGTGHSVLSKPVVVIGGASTSGSNLQSGASYQASKPRNNDNLGGGLGASGGGGTGMIALGGRSSGGNGVSSGGGGFSGGGMFSTTAPSFETESAIQKAGEDELEDLSDPGGGEPVGDPIPVGEGFFTLIIMVLMYSHYIYRKFKKSAID